MSIEEIRSYRNAKPFVPFEVTLADGRILPVVRPERLAISPWGRLGVFVNSIPYYFRIEEVASIGKLAASNPA